jgi:hypothetical protein
MKACEKLRDKFGLEKDGPPFKILMEERFKNPIEIIWFDPNINNKEN